jgi:hypothetical protein
MQRLYQRGRGVRHGEEPGHAYRDQRPDEKEMSAGIADAAGNADTLPLYVGNGDDQ